MATKMLKALGRHVSKTWQDFFKDAFFNSIWKKNYAEEEKGKPDDEKLLLETKRMTGYQQLILFGLGTMFWSVASSVMVDVQEKLSGLSPYQMSYSGVSRNLDLAFYYMIYFGVTLTIMLCGLIASSFPNSSLLAPVVAGFGALKSLAFVLITAHITSLKFHHEHYLCLCSMVASTSVLTAYWAYSAQDPLLLHIVAKLLFWFICLVCWLVISTVALIICLIITAVIAILSAFGDGCLKLFSPAPAPPAQGNAPNPGAPLLAQAQVPPPAAGAQQQLPGP